RRRRICSLQEGSPPVPSDTPVDVDLDPFASSEIVDYDALRAMRQECPVARIGVGWYLSRQSEVLDATKRVDTFASSFRAAGVRVPEEEKFISEIVGPRHARVRKVINASIAHHKAMRMESFIRDLCNEYLDPIVERGSGELMHELAVPIPINVIAHLIG